MPPDQVEVERIAHASPAITKGMRTRRQKG
jgi:hypothetical protein